MSMNGVPGNIDVTRLQAYLMFIKDVWNTFGLPTIILIVLLLLYTGVIPSPLVEARSMISELKVSIDRHLERDDEIIFYMKSMCTSNAKIAGIPPDECIWRLAR